MTAWPWGNYEHQETATRAWCFGCNEWCYEPEDDSEDEYWALCLCCREPLYVLRIAELETELARFQPCSLNEQGEPDAPPLHPAQTERGCMSFEHDGSQNSAWYCEIHGASVYHKEGE